MIDIQNETLMTVREISESLPTHPHIGTIWRWYARGLHGIRLDTVMIGGRRMSSREAMQRFTEQTTAHRDGTPTPSQTAKQKQRSLDDADKTLREAGIIN